MDVGVQKILYIIFTSISVREQIHFIVSIDRDGFRLQNRESKDKLFFNRLNFFVIDYS